MGVRPQGRFEGRVTVITGAAGALGRACATSLAREGAKLVLFDRDAEGLSETAKSCPGSEIMTGDVRSAADVKSVADVARDRFGPVEMLVAAAGVAGPSKAAIDVEEDEFDLLFDVNVKGSWLAAKYIIPHMRELGHGSVVLFSSAAGLRGSPVLPVYSASKGAVTLLTKSLALNHATENIRVNCVCPGTIESPMVRMSIEEAGDTVAQAARESLQKSMHPMRRFGKPSEVVGAVLYLLSDEAAFTTGIALPIDGGRLA
ncbi:glucose 1-dehydrogenase [Bradyrhizobium sp. LVM 105]|uniref:SDR family NAD(P)-dependent oxidoreductase n=1 Tax=Bradyrhizobium sp. LVM 105 TaxID=2341115 RepID=UPI000F80333B|nr:glucose 1-dehydrogenase [Bradyrhizobium sp. LVM 105]RTE91288.1 glucose 1-dehydrogenase [Bradyrhizobium sp. LVM 105]